MDIYLVKCRNEYQQEIGYWRNADWILGWIEKNLRANTDGELINLKLYKVEKSELIKLRNACLNNEFDGYVNKLWIRKTVHIIDSLLNKIQWNNEDIYLYMWW